MKDDNLPPDNETVEDGGGCYVAGSREQIINTHYQDDSMKEQDAAHSFDEKDANLCPAMNDYYCFDRACGIDHEKQCMMILSKDKIYVDGSKAGDYIQQHIAFRREMEMNYAKMQDELTRLRSELQQEREKLTDYKAKLRAKVMDISKYDEDLKMKVIELIDKL